MTNYYPSSPPSSTLKRGGTVASSTSLTTPKRRVAPACDYSYSSNPLNLQEKQEQGSPTPPPLSPMFPQLQKTSLSRDNSASSSSHHGGDGGFYFNDASSMFSAISSSSHRHSNEWNCPACSYHNVDKYNDHCALCGTQQDGTRSMSSGRGGAAALLDITVVQKSPPPSPLPPPSPPAEEAPTPRQKNGMQRLIPRCQEEEEDDDDDNDEENTFPQLLPHPPFRANSTPPRMMLVNNGKSRRPSTGSTAHAVNNKNNNKNNSGNSGLLQRPPEQQHNEIEDDDDLQPPRKPMSDRSAASAPLPSQTNNNAISTLTGFSLSGFFTTNNNNGNNGRQHDGGDDDDDNGNNNEQQGIPFQQGGNSQSQSQSNDGNPVDYDPDDDSDSIYDDDDDDDEASDIDTASLANSTISSFTNSTNSTISSFANTSITTSKVSNLTTASSMPTPKVSNLKKLAAYSSTPNYSLTSSSILSLSSLASPPRHLLSTGSRRTSEPPMVAPEEGMRMGKRPQPALVEEDDDDDDDDEEDENTSMNDMEEGTSRRQASSGMYAIHEDHEHPSSTSSSSSYLPPSISGPGVGTSASPTIQTSRKASFVPYTSSSLIKSDGISQTGDDDKQKRGGGRNRNISSSSQGRTFMTSQHTHTTQQSSFTSVSIDESSSQGAELSDENLQLHQKQLQRHHETMPKQGRIGRLGAHDDLPEVQLDSANGHGGGATPNRDPQRKRAKHVCLMLIFGGVLLSVALIVIILIVATRSGKNDSSQLAGIVNTSPPTAAPVVENVASPTHFFPVPTGPTQASGQEPTLSPTTGVPQPMSLLGSNAGGNSERLGSSVAMGIHGDVVAVVGDSFVRVLRYNHFDSNRRRSLLRSRRRTSGGSFQQLGEDIFTNTTASVALSSSDNESSDDSSARLAVAYHDNLIVYQLDDNNSWLVMGQKLKMDLTNDGDSVSAIETSANMVSGSVSLSKNGSRVASGAIIRTISQDSKATIMKVVVQIHDYHQEEKGWVRVIGHVMEATELSGGDSNRLPTDIETVQVELSDDGDILAILLGGNNNVLVYPLGDRQSQKLATTTSTRLEFPWILKSELLSQNYFYDAMALSGNGASVVATARRSQETHIFGYQNSDSTQQDGGGWESIDTINGVGGTSVAISELGDLVAIGESSKTEELVSLYSPSSLSGRFEEVNRVVAPRRDDSDFGSSIAVSDTSLAVGAPFDRDDFGDESGKVYLYELP